MYMVSPIPFDVKVERANLNLRVRMIGEHHIFSTGKLGYSFPDEFFDWDGHRWLLTFRAWMNPTSPTLTLESLLDVFPEEHPAFQRSTMPGGLDQIETWTINHAARKQSESGWHLKRVEDGIQGRFELAKIHPLRKGKGKIGSFASFTVRLNGAAYEGQFHLSEQPSPMAKPTAWDSSRGAKAGLPTLGKRR
jgi:hypothetical protein